jgi:hypothetical protein
VTEHGFTFLSFFFISWYCSKPAPLPERDSLEVPYDCKNRHQRNIKRWDKKHEKFEDDFTRMANVTSWLLFLSSSIHFCRGSNLYYKVERFKTSAKEDQSSQPNFHLSQMSLTENVFSSLGKLTEWAKLL